MLEGAGVELTAVCAWLCCGLQAVGGAGSACPSSPPPPLPLPPCTPCSTILALLWDVWTPQLEHDANGAQVGGSVHGGRVWSPQTIAVVLLQSSAAWQQRWGRWQLLRRARAAPSPGMIWWRTGSSWPPT